MRFEEEDIIFDDGFIIEDNGLVSGYLWATNGLVALTDFNEKNKIKDGFINFYPVYNPITRDIKLIVNYSWDEEAHEEFELPLLQDERCLIIKKMNEYEKETGVGTYNSREIAQAIVDDVHRLFNLAVENETPVRFNDENTENLVLYFNEEYSKIFVDKACLKSSSKTDDTKQTL